MKTLLPSRCPIPGNCGRSWHWKSESRIACQRRQAVRAEKAAARAARIAANPFRIGSFEFNEHERKVEKRKAATAARTPALPASPEESILARNGERQLITLDPRALMVVGLLMASDIYGVNQLLRNGGSLASDPGPMMDWEGYSSKQAFVDEAADIFHALGNTLTLDQPITVFRGIGIPVSPDDYNPDVAGIGHYLLTGDSWQSNFKDAGFAFAATDPSIALLYDGSSAHTSETMVPVLLELEVQRGLCAPNQEHRSTELFEHTFEARFLSDASGQIIFPPDTHWNVVSIDRDSDYGVPLIRMTMI